MNSIASLYLKNQVQTNSPGKLVLMLYDGVKRFTSQGIKAVEKNDNEGANNHFIRSQDILLELMSGINLEAGEIAKNLYSLYEYMHYRLVQANLKKEKEPAEEVLVMIGELRETWARMLKEKDSQGDIPPQKKAAAMGK